MSHQSDPRKFDGHELRRLTSAELRQLAGRAGRYNVGLASGPGIAACCTGDDLPLLQEALEATSSAAAPCRAALLPLPEHVEAFSRALETDLGRSLPFAEVVERFLSIAQVSDDLYFLAQAKHLLALARFLDDIRLPPEEKFVFCQAPVGLSDIASLTALHRFARDYSEKGVVQLPEELSIDGEVEIAKARKILEMEQLHKVCETYMWLASRFSSAFLEVKKAEEARQHLSQQIAAALRMPLAQDQPE